MTIISQRLSIPVSSATHYFVINICGRRYGGQRGISPIFRSGLRSSFRSSYISAIDLAYEIFSIEREGTVFILHVLPIAPELALDIFRNIVNDENALIEWLLHGNDDSVIEKIWPEDGAVVQRDLPPERLDNDEIYYREFAINFLKNVNFIRGRIYDPACSTGRCLFDLKNSFPYADVIGSDIDPKMVCMSRDLGLNVFIADAAECWRLIGNVDVMIVRFLNLEVVTQKQAQSIFFSLVGLVSRNGYLILWGHTPPHILVHDPALLELLPLRTCGHTQDCKIIFSFFVWKKIVSHGPS